MNLYIGSTLAVKPYGKVEFEYVTGEIMEIYLAILFSLLITGLIFLINAICCHTWTDLVEFLIIAAVWSIFFVFDVFFPVSYITTDNRRIYEEGTLCFNDFQLLYWHCPLPFQSPVKGMRFKEKIITEKNASENGCWNKKYITGR